MGAARRAGSWPRQLSWQTNRAGEFVRSSTGRIKRKSVLRPNFLVESPGTTRPRDRLRKRARSEMATRALDRHLRLQSGAAGHDRGARFKLSTFIYHSVDECRDCSSGNEREILGRLFFATRSRPLRTLPTLWRSLE